MRCISSTQASFELPDASKPLSNINLILGDNASGKSTVLKAIALSILGGALPSAGFRPFYLVRRGAMKPKLTVSSNLEINGESIESTAHLRQVGTEDVIEPSGFSEGEAVPDAMYDQESPLYFLCGYGSKRDAEDGLAYNPSERDKGRSARFQRVASLFEEKAQLRPFSVWLTQLTAPKDGVLSPHHDDAVNVVESLLSGTEMEWTRGIIDGEAHFRGRGTEAFWGIPFPALSDGYRAFLSWVGDLLHHLCAVTPIDQKIVNLPGIVLVDEVDAFLHPSWQRRVLADLSKTFPAIQFFVTSHSPILAGSVPRENLFICEAGEEGQVLRSAPESIYGKTAEDILLSSYFGLRSTRNPQAEANLQVLAEEREIAARNVLKNQDESSARAYLALLEEKI